MMRFRTLLLTVVSLTTCAFAQPTGWIVDDFKPGTLDPKWSMVKGTWVLADEGVKVGASENAALVHSLYIMRTKPYTIEASLKGNGGGLIFCMESPTSIANSHVVMFTGSALTTGYMDFHGRYVETRSVDYLQPADLVRLKITVDPVKRTYAVAVQDHDMVLEELRFVSGTFGLYAKSGNATFDYAQVTGPGLPDKPSDFLKSNERQLDHLSYMALIDDAIIISNPVIGIVQRLTSIGSYVAEIPVAGENASVRGVVVDAAKWTYIVDGGSKNLRIYNMESQLERIIGDNLVDPRGVAVVGNTIYVLDSDGIKVFTKEGAFVGAKATGLFKNPKNIYAAGNLFYVADMGNGKVQILDQSDFSVKSTITDQLDSPWDVSTDPSNGHIYVADPGASAVFHYDEKGAFVERIEPITIRGFISPRGVRVRGSMIYVADFERILGFTKGVLSIRPALTIN